jgi:hypothetical protein
MCMRPLLLGLGSWTVVVAFAAGCSGKTNDGNSSLGTTGNATGPEVFTPAEVQAARAACNQPDGPVQMPQTYGDAQKLVVGSWLACKIGGDSPPDPSIPMAASRQYNADGTFVDLALDAQGGLVHVYGADNQGTWGLGDDPDAGPSTPVSPPVDLYVWFDSGGGNGGSSAFESGPTRLVWNPDYFEEWFVPIATK